jgi:hypothetical protein
MIQGATHEVTRHNSNPANNNKHQIKAPSDIRKSRSRSLQVDKISQSDGRHTETHAFGANVVREEFGVEDYAGDVDAHAVYCEEEVEPRLTCVSSDI